MPQIVFINPFSKDAITGGIKTTYRHAELLIEEGFDASVFQPDGGPSWFETKVKPLPALPAAMPDDVFVFPEIMHSEVLELAKAIRGARKIIFCQNQYFLTMNRLPLRAYLDLGISRFACPSNIAKGFLQRVIGISDVAVIPCPIDGALFRPLEKTLQIAFIPRKMPREAAFIRSVFALKYPQLKALPWVSIENEPERRTAEILGRSAILLSLSHFESFGLVPVEAMASGAIVAGFHGYGGQDYATPENGLWFPPDHLQEVADALARIVTGLERNDPEWTKMREAGLSTAARYNKARTRTALRAFYGEPPFPKRGREPAPDLIRGWG